jgi:hypothetical protein
LKTQPNFRVRRISLLLAVLQFCALFLITENSPTASAQSIEVKETIFGDRAFELLWQRTDKPVADLKAERSLFWGVNPLGKAFYEPYADAAPYGRRLVQYFEKGRMETVNPLTGQVTTGSLVSELITGRVAQGADVFDEPTASSNIPMIGDLDNTSPTYRQLMTVFNRPDEPYIALKINQPVTRLWNNFTPSQTPLEYYTADEQTWIAQKYKGFGLPRAFWDFLNQTGTIYLNGRLVKDEIFDWETFVGEPVTEAYWAQVRVGGQETNVLFQAFEKRILTYTPSNDEQFRVQMANVGLHYTEWRYGGKLPNYSTPLLSTFDMDNNPQWYEVTADVLNIRNKPDTKSDLAYSSYSRPFVVKLVKGDRIQVIRTVKGEAIEKDNDRWLQIYEKPDLFVYAGYTKKMIVPDFPAPPRYHNGLWVAISLDKQMLAVYNGGQPVYRTMIATGRYGYETPPGSYRVIGGWRPISQIMEGGNRAAGDGYRLEDVRMVSYFFNNYAIHGSYWHAKYGIAPQSHGCVNATVFDAGLVHQLPVNTPVEVFYSSKQAPKPNTNQTITA